MSAEDSPDEASVSVAGTDVAGSLMLVNGDNDSAAVGRDSPLCDEIETATGRKRSTLIRHSAASAAVARPAISSRRFVRGPRVALILSSLTLSIRLADSPGLLARCAGTLPVRSMAANTNAGRSAIYRHIEACRRSKVVPRSGCTRYAESVRCALSCAFAKPDRTRRNRTRPTAPKDTIE